MTAGTWAMALLLLVANTLPPDVEPMNSRDFKLPITIEPSRRAEVQELRLFVSADQGKNWELRGRATPDTKDFTYTAPSDGIYWFILCVVDQQGKQTPENLYTAPVTLKTLVDTTPPELHVVSAERKGDEVVVKWEARDENLDPNSLKLEYRTPESPPGAWTTAVVSPTASGEGTFRPGSQGAVQVRMEVKDVAKNVASAPAEVPAVAGAAVTTGLNNTPPPAPVSPAGMPLPAPPPSSPTPFKADTSDLPNPVQPVSRNERVDVPPMLNPSAGTTAVVTGSPGQGKVAARAGGASPASDVLPSPAMTPPGTPGVSTPSAAPPPLQIIKEKRVTLEYTVANFGASGIRNVELYVTRDEGQHWQLSEGMPNAGLPMPADSQAPGTPVKQTLTVDLQGEGIYGFYLVVKSGAGLGKPPPQSGTLPQMRVELDTTPPEAVLYNPVPEPGRRDALLMSWDASDRHLGPKPVTLEWAASPDGDWKVIGERDMANTGRYVWAVPPGVPPRVFFRLTVRDLAGNVSIAETKEAILIDLSEPEVVHVQLHQAAH